MCACFCLETGLNNLFNTGAQMGISSIKCVLEEVWKANSQNSQSTQILRYFKYLLPIKQLTKYCSRVFCIQFSVAFLDLHLSISNGIVSTKIYDKRDDFDFEIVNFPFLDGDVPRSTSYGVYISQLIRFARASSIVADFNTRNKLLTQKLLKQGYRYHKLRKTFSKFYRRYYDLISKFQVGLKSLLRQGLSEPDFYSELVYKLKKIVGSNIFSAQFIKIISHYKKIGYNINVLQQTACLVFNPITVATLLSSLIARRWVGLQTLWWFRLKDLSIDEMVGAWCFGCLSGPPGFTCWISFAPVFSFIYCWVLIFALSPCYILIYMFYEMMHW